MPPPCAPLLRGGGLDDRVAPAAVVIADRDALAREGLRALLATTTRWRVRAEFDRVWAGCGDPRVAQDAVLVAAAAPELALAPHLVRQLSASARVLVAFETMDPAAMWRVLDLGACGVIAKQSSLDGWLAALDAVATRGRHVPASLSHPARSP